MKNTTNAQPQAQQYIVVRHSAFGYKGDVRFERGLEVRSCTPTAAARFKEKGAAVFDSYKEAYDFAQKESYPEEKGKDPLGLIPNAQGMFMRATVDGLQVYLPKP
jgi:hypothetical protein